MVSTGASQHEGYRFNSTLLVRSLDVLPEAVCVFVQVLQLHLTVTKTHAGFRFQRSEEVILNS